MQAAYTIKSRAQGSEMTIEQKTKLANLLSDIMENLEAKDVLTVVALIHGSSSLKKQVFTILANFLLVEMNFKMSATDN